MMQVVLDRPRIGHKANVNYSRSLQRLADHRNRLYESLCENLSKAAQLKDVCSVEFYENFRQSIADSKICLEQSTVADDDDDDEQRRILSQLPSPVLTTKLLFLKKDLLILKLLNDSFRSLGTLESLYTDVCKNYSKIPILDHVAQMHSIYRSFMIAFNTIFQINSNIKNDLFGKFGHKFINTWNERLRALMENIFKFSFTEVHWPSITRESSQIHSMITTEQLKLFQHSMGFLIDLNCGDFAIKNNLICKLDLFPEQNELHIIKLLIEPFEKRFRFYFFNPHSKLNNLEYPEWYMCQVEQWITQNQRFLASQVDPILAKHFSQYKSSKLHLIRHLLALVDAKLINDLPSLNDEKLFSLTVDELFVFLKQILFIEPAIFEHFPESNPMEIFMNFKINFERFQRLEEKKITKLTEEMFESESCWDVVYGNGFDDEKEFIICEVADKISLIFQKLDELLAVFAYDREKARSIWQLYDGLFNDFELRLSQLVNDIDDHWPLDQEFFSIFNTFYYYNSLLVQMKKRTSAMLSQDDLLEICGPEQPTLEPMIITQLLERLQNVIIGQISDQIIQYKELSWSSMQRGESTGRQPTSMTNEGAQLFCHLSSHMAFVKRFLSTPLFRQFTDQIVDQFQRIIFEKILLQSRFNKVAIEQIHFDIQHGLISIFTFYDKNLEYCFTRLYDALAVLELSDESCEQLINSYKHDGAVVFKVKLQKFGIYTLEPDTVLELIRNRI